jgi:RNA polymerase sigma factor (sigma-70 family)
VEASALTHAPAHGLLGPTPLLRLQSDERLVVLTRRGSQAAYEALVARYQSRLQAFCRHMLGSKEDAEDVLQEVFAAAYAAMVADERSINVRPWLYRIARNRSLNHLRRIQPVGVDSMDVHLAEHGTTTADKVHRREEFRELVSDVQHLAETQRTALLLREIDALSYEQIAEAMETTVPSVKSLLVRARVALAEAAEARKLSCEEVREELGEVAEGLAARVSPPVRRHLRACERCAAFRKQLRATNRALAAVFPVGPLLVLKKLLLANLGTTASAGGGAAAATAAGTGAGAGASGALSAGLSTVASKAAAGIAAAAIVTAGAVEVDHARHRQHPRPVAAIQAQPHTTPAAEPQVVAAAPQPVAAVSETQAPAIDKVATQDKAQGPAKADAATGGSAAADGSATAGANAANAAGVPTVTDMTAQPTGPAVTGGVAAPADPTSPAPVTEPSPQTTGSEPQPTDGEPQPGADGEPPAGTTPEPPTGGAAPPEPADPAGQTRQGPAPTPPPVAPPDASGAGGAQYGG